MVAENRLEISDNEFLEDYDFEKFDRPSIATDMVIFTVENNKEENYRKLSQKKLKLLMIKRGVNPFINQWALAGGFVRSGETTEQTATRELFEETAVKDVYLEQLYTFSNPNRDPRGWVVSCSYMALVDSDKLSISAGDDANDVAWFDISYKLVKEEKEQLANSVLKKSSYKLMLSYGDVLLESEILKTECIFENHFEINYDIISSNGFAFDHSKIIAYAIERLRGKLEYTNIAFNLMPKYFTLTDLQRVYEIILDKSLLPANFRRKIASSVIETDQYTENEGHRPSKLFKRKLEVSL